MEERKIPHYINDPVINRLTAPENKLFRPEINYRKAVLITSGTIIGTALLSLLVSSVLKTNGFILLGNKSSLQAFIITYAVIQIIVLAFTLKYIMIWFIRLYQRYARSETRLRCCYTPSCSEYAILALKKYGALLGGIKAARRLLRCGPPGGVDYP